jgi:hypothetical protein
MFAMRTVRYSPFVLALLATVGSAVASTISFTGTTLDGAGTLTLRIPGDANRNGQIDSDDFARLHSGFGMTNPTWSNGDFNVDQRVDTLDFSMLAREVTGAQIDPAGPEWGPVLQLVIPRTAPVPEPAVTSLAAISLAGLLRRRRASQPRLLERH